MLNSKDFYQHLEPFIINQWEAIVTVLKKNTLALFDDDLMFV